MFLIERIKAWRGESVLGLLWVLKTVSRLAHLRMIYQVIGMRLIRRVGLFDQHFYLNSNEDVAEAGFSALHHYVAHGDREGRPPNALFDPTYYRAQSRSPTSSVNALLHYHFVGRYRRLSPSPWVDINYYLGINKDVARSGRDPLLHYLTWGGTEGRSPSPNFDSHFYLHSHPDVGRSGLNPLVHYLVRGRAAGYPVLPGTTGKSPPAERAPCKDYELPFADAFSTCAPRADVADASIDVIVPVYKGHLETLRCLLSVLTSRSARTFELVVIDDCSPEAALRANLQDLAAQGRFTLLTNAENLGFVRTANRGMLLHHGRDVVLLNSDTEVYDHWLDRLADAAQRSRDAGTVTPLSNNATICSYPRFLHDNPYPLELEYRELDALTAQVNRGIEVEAPTGVGFCMYIRRDCLQATGSFDEDAFGKGYGEENDFCQRAIRKGYRNIIAADIFVRHLGSLSFKGQTAILVKRAMRQMKQRFPDYHAEVRRFVARDPLAEARSRLDWCRLERYAREENTLIIGHDRGGGSERHIQEEIQRLTAKGHGVFRMVPKQGDREKVVVRHPWARSLPNILPIPLRDVEKVASVVRRLGITEVQTHGMVDYLPDAPAYIAELSVRTGVPLRVVLHDYKVICPRINLVDAGGYYCGEPGPDDCNRCLQLRGSSFGVKDIRAWRQRHHEVLKVARCVQVPDRDMSDRISRYFPDIAITVSPHESLALPLEAKAPPVIENHEPVRIVLIGALSKIKGFKILAACARHAQKRRLPIEFVLVGFGVNDKLLCRSGVEVTGRYQEHQVLEKIARFDPHAIWLPSIWPETYSYTLSIALQCAVPVFAFDIGAIARRLREVGCADHLMPLEFAKRPASINDAFIRFRRSLMSSDRERISLTLQTRSAAR